ncbi:MAG: C25 family cysteine peptidase, partial [Bacteroidota bacterium]
MKKILLSLITLIFSAGFLTADVVEKTYQFSEPNISEAEGYQLISFENTLLTGLAGEPALPYRAVALLLPPGHVATEIQLIAKNQVVLEGSYQIYPQQHTQPMSKGGSGVFVKNEDVYLTNAAYPQQLNGTLSTQFQNGYALAMSTFTPVQYNPATGELTYFSEVTVRITTAPGRRAEAALANLQASQPVLRRLNHLVQNQEAVMQYPQPQQRSDDYDMIIITPNQFADDFGQLADFYAPRGLEVQIATTEDIYATMTGQDNQEKIRNYIIQEYQDHGIQHVTLGGDVEHVPYRGFYCTVQSSSVYTDDDIPSDLYYAGLDGTWNDNGNNLWGEIGEDDLLPEIGIGRFSVSNQDDFDALMNKTLSYQGNPVLGELRDELLVGEWLYGSPETWGADYLELLIGYQDENGYQTTGIPEDHNITKLYERDQSWSANTLKQEMNQGHSFIHHVGHANSNYAMKFYNSDITNSNFAPLNGTTHNYTLIFSHGCICGAFDDNDCIAERMINIDNLAVAVMMNSRYGWFNEGQTEGPAAHLNREFVDAIYDKKESHIGLAYALTRIETAPWVNAPGQWEEGALRWNFYDLNILGDGALNIWTDEPVDITATYQEALPIGIPSVQVSISGNGPVEGLNCVFMKDGVIYGKAETDATGNAEIVFTEPITELGDATIYVSGYNCLLHEYPVTVIPNNGAYVVYASSEINDENGNNNGIPEYTEQILLTTTLENVGTVQADNVTATLASTDPYVTITDNTEDFGNIPGESTVTIGDAFGFEIAGNVPNQHAIAFSIVCEGQDTWSSNFSVIANAPELAMENYYIDDAATGNNNGILDPGETADIVITAANEGHAAAYEVTALLTSADQYITVNTGSAQDLGDLAQGAGADAVFSVSAASNTPAGYLAEITVLFEAMYGISTEDNISLNFSDYCYPSASCSFGDGFSGFALEDIQNMDNGCSNDNSVEGYGDFTDMLTELEPGQSYTVSWSTDYDNQQASLWIDLNSNKEFEDNERLISDFELANSGQLYTTDITIPESVNGGVKRLRIRAHWQESAL